MEKVVYPMDTMTQRLNIDILIPVYNEEENIEDNLNSLSKIITCCSHNFTIYIIYDSENDNTLPVIKRIIDRYSFELKLLKNKNQGVCNAIKTGIDSANGDFILVTMADMSDDYAILPKMVEMAREGYDIVCASRYMKGGKIVGGPFIKQVLSRMASLSLYFLTRIPTHDVTNSFKLYSRELLQNIAIESDGGFEIGLEITTKAYLKGYKINEVPTIWRDRDKGESNFKLLLWIPKYLKWYFFLLIHRKERIDSNQEVVNLSTH